MGSIKMTGIWIISCLLFAGSLSMSMKSRRAIDLSQEKKLISESRLPEDIVPNSYKLDLYPNFQDNSFHGRVIINATVLKWTNEINLHSQTDMQIDTQDVLVRRVSADESQKASKGSPGSEKTELNIRRTGHLPKLNIFVIYLHESVKADTELEISVGFSGNIWVQPEGLFLGSYSSENGTKHYLATNMRPNNARRVFPCFDIPSFKVPFTVSISRPKTHTTLFNTAVMSTEPLDGEPDIVVDHFVTTPPIATFSLGFVISQFESVNGTLKDEENLKDFQEAESANDALCVRISSRREFAESLEGTYDKVFRIQQILKRYLASGFPACELKVVALPNVALIRPADSLGLIVMRESDLQAKGYYTLAQEIAFQWIGHLVTPKWWSDSHLNKAIAGFLAVHVAMEADQGKEFQGKWPMTVLYSIYYEFSKRYPHSKITGMKEDTICSKTELLMRMLNETLGQDTFRRGIQQFVAAHEYNTFTQDDLWSAITKEAHADGGLDKSLTVNEIAQSWISKDRIPLVNINRNYDEKSAAISQSVFLRERPHDVPDQEKMLWYIPLVISRQDDLCFKNFTPSKWLKEKELQMSSLPEQSQFIIVNAEEIGPFPVNYDQRNWQLLSDYLQTESGRKSIPAYTRAKLVHDAWNLGYGGHLNFATVLNMTLFMKDERNHLVWNPIFTMIDHIGRHIDISATYPKFEKYVRILLTPLYEELGSVQQPNEEPWKDNLRSLAKTFLCRMGYQKCLDEALTAYRSWMTSPNPDEGNPVSNQHICPVFQWGSDEEWNFGLMRVINFPASRKQNERTFLLKTLASCPNREHKVMKLLNVTILEQNGNFTERDMSLVINMLTGGSTGYKTLLQFLSANWDVIKQRLESKTNLWDNLISSATGSFTTQDGYDMVSELYVTRQGEFGSAEHIIEKSLKNIKEETKWSNQNLPIMDQWLADFLQRFDPKGLEAGHAGLGGLAGVHGGE